MPGVTAVLTHKDVKGTNRINNMLFYSWSKGSGFDRPILCAEKIFQYGDVVALVCADTQEHADAAPKSRFRIGRIARLHECSGSCRPDAMEIHPAAPTFFVSNPPSKGRPGTSFRKGRCGHQADYYTQRQPHLYWNPMWATLTMMKTDF